MIARMPRMRSGIWTVPASWGVGLGLSMHGTAGIVGGTGVAGPRPAADSLVATLLAEGPATARLLRTSVLAPAGRTSRISCARLVRSPTPTPTKSGGGHCRVWKQEGHGVCIGQVGRGGAGRAE